MATINNVKIKTARNFGTWRERIFRDDWEICAITQHIDTKIEIDFLIFAKIPQEGYTHWRIGLCAYNPILLDSFILITYTFDKGDDEDWPNHAPMKRLLLEEIKKRFKLEVTKEGSHAI